MRGKEQRAIKSCLHQHIFIIILKKKIDVNDELRALKSFQ